MYPPCGGYPFEHDLQGIGDPHRAATIPRSVTRTLDPCFVVQRPSFFEIGTVFAVPWAELAGNEDSNAGTANQETSFSTGRFGERVFCNIRRMVVAKVKGNWSWCLPVTTYGGRGVTKQGVDPNSHATVYLAGFYPGIVHGEPKMTKTPLEVQPFLPGERLDRMSRLNFGKVHTVEHNVRVRPIGRISSESMPHFFSYVQQEFNTF